MGGLISPLQLEPFSAKNRTPCPPSMLWYNIFGQGRRLILIRPLV